MQLRTCIKKVFDHPFKASVFVMPNFHSDVWYTQLYHSANQIVPDKTQTYEEQSGSQTSLTELEAFCDQETGLQWLFFLLIAHFYLLDVHPGFPLLA